MKPAIIAGIVAMLVSAASATAAFVVTSANIKNGTIQTVDLSAKAKRALRGQRGPRGFDGPEGVMGPQGAPGPSGPPGKSPSYTAAYSEHTTVPPGSFRFAEAICPAGTAVVGGAYATEHVSSALLVPTNAYPIGTGDGRGAWYVVMHNIGSQEEAFWARAFCVSSTS